MRITYLEAQGWDCLFVGNYAVRRPYSIVKSDTNALPLGLMGGKIEVVSELGTPLFPS